MSVLLFTALFHPGINTMLLEAWMTNLISEHAGAGGALSRRRATLGMMQTDQPGADLMAAQGMRD